MCISKLPPEVLEEVFSYLPINDLLSCSLVCTEWRNLVNCNRIWYDLCMKKSPLKYDKIGVLTETEYVEPNFRLPPDTCERLDRVCKWRVRYMQETHLIKNWLHGRCVINLIVNHDQINVPLEDPECDENVLLLSRSERREFTVFDISSNPKRTQTIPYSLKHVSSNFFKLINKRLVILQCTLLQVFEEDDNYLFHETFKMLFDRPERESSKIRNTSDATGWYDKYVGLYPSDIDVTCDHNGEYFAGMVNNNSETNLFHIWNIVTGKKITSESVPSKDEIINASFSMHGTSVYMILKMLKKTPNFESYTELICFNLKTLSFKNFSLVFKKIPVAAFSDTAILIVDINNKCLELYDNESGTLFSKFYYKYDLQPLSLHFVGKYLLFAENNEYSGIVQVIHIKDLEDKCKVDIFHRVTSLHYIREPLILVETSMKVVLWDFRTCTNLVSLSYRSCIWFSIKRTKLVIEDENGLSLVRFW